MPSYTESFRTYANYVRAFAQLAGRSRFTIGPGALGAVNAGIQEHAVPVPVGIHPDAIQARASLNQAWGTELVLNITARYAQEDELVGLSNTWVAVQVYYTLYHSTQALLAAHGYKRPETHSKTQRMFCDLWVTKPNQLAPWAWVLARMAFSTDRGAECSTLRSTPGPDAISKPVGIWPRRHCVRPATRPSQRHSVGCVKPSVTSVPAYYDVWRSTRDGYQERDKQVYPALGTWNSYEIVYDSYDPTGHNYYWDVLVNGNRIEQVINNDLQTIAQAAAGGETNHPADLNGISVLAQPQVLLQSPSMPWTEWTPTLMTTAGDSTTTCVDPYVTWTYMTQFDKYSAYGIVQ